MWVREVVDLDGDVNSSSADYISHHYAHVQPGPWPAVHEALQQSWVRFDEAAVLRIESRSAGPCRFSLNRGAGKVAGKVLIVDQLYCSANLLK